MSDQEGSSVASAGPTGESEGSGQDAENVAKPSGRDSKNLKSLALSGGIYLTIREAVGMCVRLAGVVVITRLLGPSEYGIYFGASSFITVIATAAQMGSELWLIRQDDEPSKELMDKVWTALLLTSVAVSLVALLITLPAQAFIDTRTLNVFRLLIISVPINVLWAPAQARIERDFGYKKMAWLELGGDLTLYGVGVPLALAGFGVWSMVIAYLAWQAFLLIGSQFMAHYRASLRWDRELTTELVRHGLGYSSNDWAQRLGLLSATVVVGIFSGSTGVGLVGLAARLVDTVSFSLRATWRLGMATLSRLNNDRVRLARAVDQAMLAQTVVLCIPMAMLAVTANWVIPTAFGKVWTPAIAVFVLLCVAKIFASPVQLLTTMLYMQGKITEVTRGSVANAVLLWVLAFPLTAIWHLKGYAVATILSTVGWLLVDRAARRVIEVRYGGTAICIASFIPPLFFPLVHSHFRWLLLLPVVIPALVPSVRNTTLGLVGTVLGRFLGREVVIPGVDSSFDSSGGTPMKNPLRGLSVTLAVVRRRGAVFVAVFLVVAGVSFLAGRNAAPTYSAYVYAVVDAGATSAGPGQAAEAANLATTYASAIPQDQSILEEVGSKVAQSPSQVADNISVFAADTTADLTMTFTSTSPQSALQGAGALASAVSGQIFSSPSVPRGSVDILSISDKAVQASGTHKNAEYLGVLGGFLLALVVVLALERMNPRIDSLEDLETILGLPVSNLEDLRGGSAVTFLRRWKDLARANQGDLWITPSQPAAAAGARALLGLSTPASSSSPDHFDQDQPQPDQFPEVGVSQGWPVAEGASVLVVIRGEKAKTVLQAADAVSLVGCRPCWAVLSSPGPGAS